MDYAKNCFIETKALSVYIQRNQVVVREDGLVDLDNEFNKRFLEKRILKNNSEPKQEVKIKTSPKKETIKQEEKTIPELQTESLPKNIPIITTPSQSYTESERVLKYLDTLKRTKEIEKLEIDINKKLGVVVPSELIKPIWLQHNQFILTELKNAVEDILRIIIKKKDLSVNESAEIRGSLIASINQSMDKASNSSIKNLNNIISEFSEKKNVGEHG